MTAYDQTPYRDHLGAGDRAAGGARRSHSIETARGYSLPTEADKQAAIERLAVDE